MKTRKLYRTAEQTNEKKDGADPVFLNFSWYFLTLVLLVGCFRFTHYTGNLRNIFFFGSHVEAVTIL